MIALDRPKRGHEGPASSKHHLDPREPVTGVVALARGRNPYLGGGLCETAPAVQDYWLRCVGECLDAGVDGVEFRVENHSCHSEGSEAYGFNEAVLAKVPRDSGDLLADITKVRSEAYTDFLRSAKRLIASRGRRMRVNLNLDWFRPPHERPGSRKLAYPANIDFPWRQWVSEGLLDEAMLRPFAKPFAGIFPGDGEDPVAQEMIAACRERGIPLAANRYVWANEELLDEFQRVLADERLSGFVLYETWSYTRLTAGGAWELAEHAAPPSPRSSASLWKTRAATAGYVRQVFEHWRGAR